MDRRQGSIRGALSFFWALWKVNLASILEYRFNFVMQAVGMMLNDALFCALWLFVFWKFPIHPGFPAQEYLLVFGFGSFSIGLSRVLFGNTESVAEIIATGGVDTYLVWPKPVALHLVSSRTQFHGIGDAVFGVLCAVYVWGLNPFNLVFFIFLGVLATFVFHGFEFAVQSLAFWLGHARDIADQMTGAVILFGTYPLSIFEGITRLMLFTLIPAAYIAGLPTQIITSFSWPALLGLIGAAIIVPAIGYGLFYLGLRRYESGSGIANRV